MRFTAFAAVIAIVAIENPVINAVRISAEIPATTDLELDVPTLKDRESVAPPVKFGEDCPGPAASRARWLYGIPKTTN